MILFEYITIQTLCPRPIYSRLPLIFLYICGSQICYWAQNEPAYHKRYLIIIKPRRKNYIDLSNLAQYLLFLLTIDFPYMSNKSHLIQIISCTSISKMIDKNYQATYKENKRYCKMQKLTLINPLRMVM